MPAKRSDAARAGITPEHLRGRSWRRLGRGLYAWAGLAENPALLLAGVQRRLPPEAAFSGRTAAWLHGLDLPPCTPIEVTVPRSCGISARAEVAVHRAELPDGDVIDRRGMRATSALRTVVDLSRRLPLVEATVAIDMALHRGLLRLDQLHAHITAHRHSKGIVGIRHVAELAEPAAESPMETRLRLLLVLGGLPRPEAQVPLHDVHGHFLGRPDLYYRAQRLALEYDGGSHRESLAEDNRRQNGLVNAGFRLLRFTAADVLRTPDSVVHQVRAALGRGV